MILRYLTSQPLPLHLFSLLLLLSSAVHVTAQDFDCRSVSAGELSWDLMSLNGVHTVRRTRDSPPTTMVDELRFNLCEDLTSLEDVAEGDQCPSGTRACLTKTNQKEGDSDRVIAAIPVAVLPLHAETALLSSSKSLSLTLHGHSYPGSAEEPIPQSVKFSLWCADEVTDPRFASYEDGQVHVEWSTPSGCGSTSEQQPPQDDDKTGGGGGGNSDEKPQSVGSGLGFFFLVLLLAFGGYFALGAYYNYSTYGARGVDLIPHRDFWREVPYMLQDVVSHLCSTVRPRRSSRGGYIAV